MNLADAKEIAAALGPLVDRVRVDVSWVKRNGEQRRTNEPLTPERLLKHLNGGPARGVVPMQPGQAVTMVALLDFDSHKGETPWPEMQAAALRVCAALRAAGAEPIAFRSSGGKGIHLYVLWDGPQGAYSVRLWLAGVLASVDLADGPGGVSKGEVEVFPKQDAIEPGRFGNQFILPLAGQSVPLDPFDLDELPREWLVGFNWPVSRPVPVVEKPAPVVRSGPISAELEVIRSAIQAIPDGADCLERYAPWLDIIHAIHSGSGGSPDGLALAHEFSQRSSDYDADEVDEKWAYARNDRERPITVGTLFKAARELGGWQEPPDPGAFGVIEKAMAPADPPPLPAFERDKASGAVLAKVGNFVAALRRADVCGFHIGHDAFRDEITVAQAGTSGHRPMTDADVVRIRIELERLRFKVAPKELVRDAAVLVAAENAYDSAQLWLGALAHDGKPRVERFLPCYMGTADTPYTRAVSRYMWSALAGRVLQPGVKADMVPIYEGDQGLRKSTAIEAIAPAPEFFTEIDLADKEDDSVRKLRGVLVAEIAELSGLHTRALESIKKFISRTHEKWVPKYREFATTFARRLLFIGTTNRTDLLGDETGNRRWLPVHVTRADAEAIARDREQLWAEGAALFRAHGVCWQEAEKLAPHEHDAYTLEDAWADPVARWLATPDALEPGQGPRGALPFMTCQALLGAVQMSVKDQDRRAANRLGAILRSLGYEQGTARIDGKSERAWKKRA